MGGGVGAVLHPPPPPPDPALLIFPKFIRNNKHCSSGILQHSAFSNILIQAFVQNLVFLTRPNLLISSKTQTGVFPISGYLVNAF